MPDDFTQLRAWQHATELAEHIQKMTRSFPQHERYNLISQMRKAAVSVTANIAEGFGRYTFPDKKHKYVQARGELIELMNFLHYSTRVGYLTEKQRDDAVSLAIKTRKLINGLIKAMKARMVSDAQ